MVATNRTSMLVVGILGVAACSTPVVGAEGRDRLSSRHRRPLRNAYVPANYPRASAPVRHLAHSTVTRHSHRPAPAYLRYRYDPAGTYVRHEYRPAPSYVRREYRPVPGRVGYVTTYRKPLYSVARVIDEAPVVEYVMPLPEKRVVRYRRCLPSPLFSVVLHHDRPFRFHRLLDRLGPQHCGRRHHGFSPWFHSGSRRVHRNHRYDAGFGIRFRW